MSLVNAILLLTNVPIFIVALYSAFYYQRFGRELKIFSLFLFLSAVIQGTSVVLYLFDMNNMPFLHMYTSVGGVLLILFYRAILKKYLSERILAWLAVLFVLFSVLDSLFYEHIFSFNRYALILQSMIMLILGIATFSLLLQEKSHLENELLRKSINWINSGMFIYFCSTLILYYFDDYLEQINIDYINFRLLWILHSLFTVTMYSCFFIGLWKSPKN